MSEAVATPVKEEQVPLRRIFAFFAMIMGMFMAIIDIQIVSASLAEIQAGLGASTDEAAWVQTSYLIAEVIMIPLSASAARILSTRVFFTISAAGFTMASILAATATNIDQMIVYRAFQGFIGGGLIPSVFAAAFTIFPASKRHIVSPAVGLVATLAPTIGPTVGGYLSHTFSWHWLFLINVMPGILVSIAAWNLIDFDEPEHELVKKFDWWGLAGMAVFLGSLEYVLEEGNNKGWLSDTSIAIGTALIIGGAILFFFRAVTAKFPIADLSAFKDRNFAFGSLFSFVMGIGLYGLTYIYPVYLSAIRGYDSLMIGKAMMISGIAMFISAPISGVMSRFLDPRFMMMIGFTGFGAGTWVMSHMTADWDYYELILPQVLRGMSMMIAMVPINNVALGTLAPERIKGASSLYNLMRNLGGAVGLAIINTMLTHQTTAHYQQLAEHVQWANAEALSIYQNMVAKYNALGLDGTAVAIKNLSGIVRQQAYVMSFIDVFMVLSALFAMLVVAALALRKPASTVQGAGGH